MSVPIAPTNVIAYSWDNTIDLTWDSVYTASSYTISYGVTGSTFTQETSNTNSKTFNLSNWISYSFYVTATNTHGTSTPSNTVISIPGAPSGLLAKGGNTIIDISWNSVLEAASYTITYNYIHINTRSLKNLKLEVLLKKCIYILLLVKY
jgi:hypothetical protein